MQEDGMQDGVVLSLGRGHGYGYLRSGDASEYFFHASACVGVPFERLRIGDRVSFTSARGARGPVALMVRRRTLVGVITGIHGGGGPGGGYAFLRPLVGGEERYVHFSRLGPSGLPVGELFGTLRVGDLVSYRESPGNRGMKARAVDVTPMPNAQLQGAGEHNPAPYTELGDTTMQQNHDLLLTMTEAVRHEATVAHLVYDRGFGFLSPHNSVGRTLFFHLRDLHGVAFDDLEEGMPVTFAEGLDRDGRPCAVDVRALAEVDARSDQ